MTQWTENGLIRELDLGSGTVPFYRDGIWEGPELYVTVAGETFRREAETGSECTDFRGVQLEKWLEKT